MDLRMVKTRYQIKEAFLILREKLMPEKIKVKDICEKAMINKTTFYHHYADSMALSNEIDDHTIDCVISDFSERDQLFEDPKAYVMGLLRALERESANLKVVFRGKQEILCAKLEERLYNLCGKTEDSVWDGVRLSFVIGGFVRVVKDYLFSGRKYSAEELAEYIAQLIKALPVQKQIASANEN